MTLLYLASHGLARDELGRLGLPTKTASALAEYATRWKGRVAASSLLEPSVMAASSTGMTWEDDVLLEGVSLLPRMTGPQDIQATGSRLVQVMASAPRVELLDGLAVPIVFNMDNSPEVRRQLSLVSARGVGDRIRITFGAMRQQFNINRRVRSSAGIQCNGFASFDYYREIHPRALRFFDHRIRESDIEEAKRQPFRTPDGELVLGFSGRFMEIKGVNYLPKLMAALRARGVKAKLLIIGEGPLGPDLRKSLDRRDEILGFVDFHPDWKNAVRSSIDLMVLPHVQGDSSSTYFESLGCGVPLLGFDNDTLDPLLNGSRAGWAVPRGDVDAMASKVARIAEEPDQLRIARRNGLAFMENHTLEKVFDCRLAHLEECSLSA